ncbi:MAG: 7-cyano-7-deazaguanine synthase QueC [Oscillatoriales cyanobacterium SM2_1_8]|nr:7-cyano-7-deazaguanine synthase QueC [Oscillatoriales cyanobacterium SM2_1_8]
MKRAVVLLSGGLDSATVAAQALTDGFEVLALSFRYGQRHVRELRSARTVAKALGIGEHFIVDVKLNAWGGSALTDEAIAVPTEGVQPGTIPVTYVPGRNTVFIALALSLAEAREAVAIYLGINAVDYSGYPDCRPEYLAAFQGLAALSSKVGVEGQVPRLVAPLIGDTKVDIVRRAIALGVPIAQTRSCYQDTELPCGVCDACRIRDRALMEAGCPDLATPVGRAGYRADP